MITIVITYKTGMVFTIAIPAEAVEDVLPCMLDQLDNIVEYK